MATKPPSGKTPLPLQYSPVRMEDLQTPEGVSAFNQQMQQIVNALNAGNGVAGRVVLPHGIDVAGSTVSGLAAPKAESDAISAGHADSNYGAGALGPKLDIGGTHTLKGLTGLWLMFSQQKNLLNPMTSKGDLIVGGNVTDGTATPERLPAGTSGDVLTSNGPGALPSYKPGGSASGVTSLNGLTGGVSLVEGENITIEVSGLDIIIASAAAGINELFGDVIAGPGSGSEASKVVKIQNIPVSATVPISGKVLKYDGTQWAPADEAGGMANPMTTVGDLIVGGTVTGGVAAPARLAAGTSGQVLTSNGPGVAPSYQPGGGGGHSYEGFGNLESIAALTKLSGASANITLTDGTLSSSYVWTASGSNTLQLAYTAAPATPWTYYLRFFIGSSFANNVQFGLVVRNSVSGKLTILAYSGSGGLTITVQEWNSPTSFSSTLVTVSAPPSNSFPLWLEINNDGTNLSFSYGPNGVNWTPLITRALSAFMGSVDQVGLGGVPIAASSAWVSDFGDVTPS